MQQKIQCPNCGATSQFSEKRPGVFICSYCGSSFEHISIVPNINLDKSLYDQIDALFHDLVELKPESAKYHERILAGIIQMNGLIGSISDVTTVRNAFHMMEEIVKREVVIYAKLGITSRKFSEQDELMLENDFLVKALFLKQILAVWSYNLGKLAVNENELNTALSITEEVELFDLPVEVPLVIDVSRTKFGLLRRLQRNTEAFAYLEQNLAEAKDKEDFWFRFEDVFLSSDYMEFKKKA